jgi:ribosomal protein L34
MPRRAKGRDSTCAGHAQAPAEKQSGLSAMVNAISPRDALEARLTKGRQKLYSKH